jgi:FAD/FMN-containing dehydrogenase
LQDAAADAGFLFPLSMASEGSMQIGGAIGTNAGGTAVLRYGNTRNLVLGVEVVLPDGAVISNLKKLVKDNTGYNLTQLFIGSEGTLGIITAATMRLFPAQRNVFTAVVAVPSAAAALDLFAAFRHEGAEYLTSFEIMSLAAVRLVMKHIPNARFPGKDGAPYYLLIEFSASSPSVPLATLFENVVMTALNNGQAQDAVLAESAAQTKQFWHVREHIPDALRAQGNRMHFDIAVPLVEIADFLTVTGNLIGNIAPDIVLIPFGHIGDGNLHYNMYATTSRSAEEFAVLKHRIQDVVFGEVDRRQGSISAEHGIGAERKATLMATKPKTELDVMRRIKCALDPDNIMNPGKIFDTE